MYVRDELELVLVHTGGKQDPTFELFLVKCT